MSATLAPEAELTEAYVFETTAEWECWQHGMIPSGGSVQRALAASPHAIPSGSEGGYLEQIVRGGFTLGLVVAAASAPIGSPVERGPVNLAPTVAAAPALAPRRREEDAPEDTFGGARAAVASPAPGAATRAGDTVEAQSAAAVEMVVITAAEQIAAVQEALSIPVTQLSEILHVARGTVYGWMRGDVAVPRDHGDAQRLRDLYRVARAWRSRCGEDLGRLIAAPLGDDQPSLLELLAADTWDDPTIDRALAVLADRVAARSQERRQARERGVGRARVVTPETVELERLQLRSIT